MRRLLIADDHLLLRETLRDYMVASLQGFAVLEAGSLEEVLEQLEKGEAQTEDLVLLDWRMPGMQGARSIEQVVEHAPGTQVLILSGSLTPEQAEAALKAGARGIVPKSLSAKATLRALKLVAEGGTYLPPLLEERLRESLRDLRPPCRPGSSLADLSPRQQEILRLLAMGLPNKEIAARLGLTEVTVKEHVSKLLKNLGVTNRTQAARLAIEQGFGD